MNAPNRPALLLAIPTLAIALAACSEDETTDLDTRDAGPRPVYDGGPPPARDGGPIDAGFRDAGPRDGGSGPCVGDPSCVSCQADGECCEFSINCQPGSICNLPDDDLFDPTRPQMTCIRVVCTNDTDCEAPKICSLGGICIDPTCQNDSECPNGNVCQGGRCVPTPDPDEVVRCEVIGTAAVIKSGSTAALATVAFDANDEVVPGAAVTYSSSDANVASIVGSEVVGGGAGGRATVTAQVGRVTCSGSVTVTNFTELPPQAIRVVALDARRQGPIVGASVTLIAGGPSTDTTGASGAALFMLGIVAPESVTVSAPGYAVVTVMAPFPEDLVVGLPLADVTNAAGVRGSVDLSRTRRADIQMGLVASNLPPDVLAFGRTPTFGAGRPIQIRAPQLGLDSEEDLPTGFMFGLGSTQFTAVADRCYGDTPGAQELGCFLARGRHGHGATWTLSGELKLSSVTAVANDLSNILAGNGPPPPELSVELAPIVQSLWHGVAPAVRFEPTPNVNTPNGAGDCSNPRLPNYTDNCEPDYSRFSRQSLVAAEDQRVLSVVDVPSIPAARMGACGEESVMNVVAASRLIGRGLVPLGFGFGVDQIDDVGVPDCIVRGVEQPFGPQSETLADGQVPLSSAPRHGGLEDGDLMLLTVVRSNSWSPVSRVGIVERRTRIAQTEGIAGAFLDRPRATIDTTGATIAYTTPGGTFTRTDIYGDTRAWIVYAPSNSAQITLPNVAAGRSVLTNATGAVAAVAETTRTYVSLFDLGERTRAHDSIDYVTRFATEGCAADASADCTLR